LIKLKSISIVTVLLLLVTGCDLIEKTDDREVIARVNDSYLYKDDVASLIAENATSEDSALIVSNSINCWATQEIAD